MEQEPKDYYGQRTTAEGFGPAAERYPANNPAGPAGGGVPPRNRKRGFAAIVIACSLVTGTLGGVAGAMIANPPAQTTQSGTATQNGTVTPSGTNNELQESTKTVSSTNGEALTVAQITQKVSPSVVCISTQVNSTSQGPFGAQEEDVTGAGSGIVISTDGYIVTNEHVISGASSIKVATSDGKEYTAKVVGSDSQTDIAVIKIDATGLTPATFGDSGKLQVGDTAVAIGNPLGELANTVTVGIISALDRDIELEGQTMRLLQTDAAINPGNSGGALINSAGEVIGINTAKTSAVGVEGLGFAIPINDVKSVIDSLKTMGYVEGRTKLGIYTRDIDSDTARMYNLTEGVYVVSVEQGSGAEAAGIKSGDIITAFDGKSVKTTSDINTIKKNHKAGDTVGFTVVRNGQKIDGSLKLGEDK